MAGATGKQLKVYASKTEAQMQALTATEPEALGFSSDKESLVFNGKTIRGVSADGKAWLEEQVEAVRLEKLKVSWVSWTPADGGEFTGAATRNVVAKIKVTYDGAGVAAKSVTGTFTPASGTATAVTYTAVSGETGAYTATVPINLLGVVNGKQVFTLRATAVYNDGSGDLSRGFAADWYSFAPMYTFSQAGTAAPTAAAILAGAKRLTNRVPTGSEVTFATVSGQYFVIAVPAGIGALNPDAVTSGGYGFPMVAMADVSVTIGGHTATYHTYRTQDVINDTSVSIKLA